jgi:hypothetical protein
MSDKLLPTVTRFNFFSCSIPSRNSVLVNLNYIQGKPKVSLKYVNHARHLMAHVTWEAEIGRVTVQSQHGQIVPETPISKSNQSKMDCRCGSSGRAPVSMKSWVQTPVPHKKERKKEKSYKPGKTVNISRLFPFFYDSGDWTQGLGLANEQLCYLIHASIPFPFSLCFRASHAFYWTRPWP